MSRRIEDLAPYFRTDAQRFWDDVVAHGPRCMIYNTARTEAEQVALYAQGREEFTRVNALRVLAGMRTIAPSENLYTVTNADGIHHKSAHQSLEALDIVVLNERGNPTWDYVHYADEYKALRDIGREHGLDCGGDWLDGSPYAAVGLGWDPPHFQRRKA